MDDERAVHPDSDEARAVADALPAAMKAAGQYLGIPSSPEPRWHEIATEGLPPEGARVLLGWAGHDQVFAARWYPEEESWRNDYGDRVHGLQPTHWHPLPAPPTKEPR